MSEMTFGDLLLQKDGLIKGPFGGDIKKSLFVPKADDTYKVYEQGVVLNRDINRGDYFVSKEYFEKKLKRFEVKENDILLTGAGTLGELFVVPPNAPKGVINQALLRIRLNKEVVDQNFFCYYFKYYVKSIISNINGDSVIPNLPPLPIIKSTVIDIPDISYQQKIAAVLTALDAKIELNARINAELESMAKTVFRYQFIENKEKGNWEIGTLGDIAENIRRSANPNEINPETHYIGLEHMPRKNIALAEYGNASELESNKYAFKTGEFLFGKLRPYFHKVGIAPVDGVCSTDILVIAPKSPEWYGFVLGHISSDEIIKYADATSGGTKMPRTNWESLAKFEISMPPVETAKEFSEFFVPIAKQIRTNILESQTLTELRDWLLPMLMNGQITVS